MQHETIDFNGNGSSRSNIDLLWRMILASSFIGLGILCSSCENAVTNTSVKLSADPTPVSELAVPSDWKRFDIGPFVMVGPADLKDKKVHGIDSEVFEFENNEFSIGIEVGMYSGYASKYHSYEYETGSILIAGGLVQFEKEDLNKPASNAARNAAGSTSKPVEKHLSLTVWIPKEQATVSVNYAEESSTKRALTILQSLRLKQVDQK